MSNVPVQAGGLSVQEEVETGVGLQVANWGPSINQQVPEVIRVEEVTDALASVQAPQVVISFQGWGEAD